MRHHSALIMVFGLSSVSREELLAAKDLGARGARIARRILAPALVSTVFPSFAVSGLMGASDVSASTVNAGPEPYLAPLARHALNASPDHSLALKILSLPRCQRYHGSEPGARSALEASIRFPLRSECACARALRARLTRTWSSPRPGRARRPGAHRHCHLQTCCGIPFRLPPNPPVQCRPRILPRPPPCRPNRRTHWLHHRTVEPATHEGAQHCGSPGPTRLSRRRRHPRPHHSPASPRVPRPRPPSPARRRRLPCRGPHCRSYRVSPACPSAAHFLMVFALSGTRDVRRAAEDSGASRTRTIVHVVIPMRRGRILAALAALSAIVMSMSAPAVFVVPAGSAFPAVALIPYAAHGSTGHVLTFGVLGGASALTMLALGAAALIPTLRRPHV